MYTAEPTLKLPTATMPFVAPTLNPRTTTMPVATDSPYATASSIPREVFAPDPDTIGLLEIRERGGVSANLEIANLRVQFSEDPSIESYQDRLTVFDVDISRDDDGLRVLLNSGPIYTAAIAFLTDGVDGWIIVNLTTEYGGGESAVPESTVCFEQQCDSPGQVDFAGTKIGTMELILDETAIGEERAGPPLDWAIHGYLIIHGNPD